ncbi:hypothetical protein ESY86_02000 [Subsaximicrobium wynnwilliamsii]|uniref:PorT family protein n=1 Tax=Subsaximicrobium wynnwilliamsii TaxID=291179 RepID=A0A5C6ZM34_9FLAO|nr:hypothetical protein [Subsaximicrobium wynnwilliamsii]TXD85405.1 hypothetical protein ESY87_00310 [Subsaximicrobium wynnwilliamsii]TXD90758.1 hypothetical protein ESY86_02000 [Subsaximicrobium wynnwilliamsii]TXE05265.1 hypothetical protein ESY88_00310 [Subsaximicrobium wynnwilliamsii]
MTTITKYVVLGLLCLISLEISAQEQQADSLKIAQTSNRIKSLVELKERIETEEREFLKSEVEAINARLEDDKITKDEAEALKSEAAQKRAQNIENRLAIIDNKIALLERNPEIDSDEQKNAITITFRGENDEEDISIWSIEKNKSKPKVYDERTYSNLVFAIGVNNAIIDGESLGDTYSFLGSGFVELGVAWNTRVLKNSNAIRFKYGLSFQWNKFSPKDDQYFEQNGNSTTLETFPSELRQSQFRVTNVVVPIFFEFGPSKKIEKEDYFRYTTHKQVKFGVGAYGGFNIGTQQKLKYKEDGDRVKQKIRRNYNTSDFVYGLSAYIGIDEISLYAKYDLNTVFKDQLIDQNNVSLGVRFDFD